MRSHLLQNISTNPAALQRLSLAVADRDAEFDWRNSSRNLIARLKGLIG